MPSQFISPFDFKTIFINYFLGNQDFFAFFFVIIFSFMGATLNLSNRIFLILLGLGLIMFGSYTGQAIYTLVLFVIGFITYQGFSKLFK